MILGLALMLLISAIVGDYIPAMIGFPIAIFLSIGITAIAEFIKVAWYVVLGIVGMFFAWHLMRSKNSTLRMLGLFLLIPVACLFFFFLYDNAIYIDIDDGKVYSAKSDVKIVKNGSTFFVFKSLKEAKEAGEGKDNRKHNLNDTFEEGQCIEIIEKSKDGECVYVRQTISKGRIMLMNEYKNKGDKEALDRTKYYTQQIIKSPKEGWVSVQVLKDNTREQY